MGGSCAAVIEFYCFYPWLLNLPCVAQDIIRMEDFDFDALVLRFAHAYATIKLIRLDKSDVGNKTVTMVSLLFMRVIAFAINPSTESWR